MRTRTYKQSYVLYSSIQDGFQSERQQSSQTIHQCQDLSDIKGMTLQYHIRFSVHALLKHFKNIFNDKGFKTTEVFPNKIMLVKLSFIDRIKFVFTSTQPIRYLLSIKTQQYKNVRKVTIKKLHPDPNTTTQSNPEQIKQLINWIEINPIEHLSLKKQQNQYDDFDLCSQCQQDIYSLQATSTYMFHKIFIDQNYSIGKKMAKLVKDRKNSLCESSKKDALLAIGGLQQITEDMLMDFNCTRKQLLQILCYCRKTVQDYYHDRRFHLKSKDQIQYERGLISTQIAQHLPQTIKSFYRLIRQQNSQKILLSIFQIGYIFKLECQIKKITPTEKTSLAKKLHTAFIKYVQSKIKILTQWGYPQILYYQYLQPFIN